MTARTLRLSEFVALEKLAGLDPAVLAKAMDEKSLRQVQSAIAAKKVSLTEEEARDLSKRALQFKNERGRLPDINSADAWEKRMAEGVAAFARYRALAKSAQAQGAQSNG